MGNKLYCGQYCCTDENCEISKDQYQIQVTQQDQMVTINPIFVRQMPKIIKV